MTLEDFLAQLLGRVESFQFLSCIDFFALFFFLVGPCLHTGLMCPLIHTHSVLLVHLSSFFCVSRASRKKPATQEEQVEEQPQKRRQAQSEGDRQQRGSSSASGSSLRMRERARVSVIPSVFLLPSEGGG